MRNFKLDALLTGVIALSIGFYSTIGEYDRDDRGDSRRDTENKISAVATITRKECIEYGGTILGNDDGTSEYVRCKLPD